jgi:hypothetical protein
MRDPSSSAPRARVTPNQMNPTFIVVCHGEHSVSPRITRHDVLPRSLMVESANV